MILTVDPGKVTGYGVLTVKDGALTTVHFDQLEMDDFLWAASDVIEKEGRDLTIVCESFQVTQRSVQQRGERLWSVEQIGVLRWLAKRAFAQYLEQSPSDAKSFATDAKLRRIGWWVKGKEHSRDAARHALLYCARNNLIDPATLLP